MNQQGMIGRTGGDWPDVRNRAQPLLIAATPYMMGYVLVQRFGESMPDVAIYALAYASIAVAYVTNIDGGWPVVPRMVLGFLIAQAAYWSIFYLGDWYFPGNEDFFYCVAFGCCGAAVLGTLYIQTRRPRESYVARGVYLVSMFLLGIYSIGLGESIVHRLPTHPELAAIFSAFTCAFVLCLLRPRS